MTPDPAERMARVRQEFAKQQAKMPRGSSPERPGGSVLDHLDDEAPTGVPAPDLTAQLEAAQKAGDWKTVLQLLHGQPRPDNAA